ncbi:MAG: hypothetical protein KBT03_03480 [Bacteroidales bacterium]|nr:hypothetical protein [Candidatus Scybalousia scybalohippi]
MKRSGKFYRRNEQDVMSQLGLQPTKNSGSGWIEKEDGQSEDVICQLKSTDASSIKVNKKDLDVLQYNATVAHKLPVFAIQFLQSQEVYLVLKPEMLPEIVKYIETGERVDNDLLDIDISEHEQLEPEVRKTIKSSSSAREMFNRENEKQFQKKRRSAK